jgi:hypothetical protein
MMSAAGKVVGALALVLCAGPAFAQTAEQLVGRWGLASYFREADAAQVTAAAAAQCRAPYVIAKGLGGGVMLHRPDEAKTSEHVIKSSLMGKTYIGPAGEAGGAKDREVVSFDGSKLVLRWVDDSVANRYGTMVFVRCRR